MTRPEERYDQDGTYVEKTIIIEEGPARELVDRVAGWIARPDRALHPRVAALYGGRGSGKTSMLRTLLRALRESPERDRLVLPEDPHAPRESNDPDIACLFKPADLRNGDEILFELLSHIDRLYRHRPIKKKLKRAREIETLRKDFSTFRSYESEIGASQEELKQRLIDLHDKRARSTTELRKQFMGIIDSLRSSDTDEKKTLVLFIDDLDLRPEIALEVLEICHLFLHRPGVAVVITADKDLLLHAIEQQKHDLQQSGLSAALLEKYVPYQWHLPIPTAQERFNLLWSGNGGNELRRWWPDSDQLRARRGWRIEDHAFARQQLAAFLPLTYRQLGALHNSLVSLRPLIAQDPTQSPLLCNERYRSSLQTLLTRDAMDFAPAFVTLLLAIDVQYPALGLWQLIQQEAEDTRNALASLVSSKKAKESADSSTPDSTPEDPFSLPYELFERLRPPFIPPDRKLKIKNYLHRLAIALSVLRGDDIPPELVAPPLFVCVSVNADAKSMSRILWALNFSEGNVIHIDVQQPGADATNVQPAELRTARQQATVQLRDNNLLTYTGNVELVMRAKLCFALWLGWELWQVQNIRVYNWVGGQYADLNGPPRRIQHENRGRFDRLEQRVMPTTEGTSGHAVVILDLIGRAQPVQTMAFYDHEEVQVRGEQHLVLAAPAGSTITPEDVVPLLEDCIELIGSLQREGIHDFHLAFVGPDAMAFLLGQQLRAYGSMHIYEWYNDRYRYVFDLDRVPMDIPSVEGHE